MHNLFFNLLMIIPTLQKEYIIYRERDRDRYKKSIYNIYL